MNQERYEKIIGRQRDRSIASILDFKEKICDEFLPDDVRKNLRKHVLDNINDLANLALDLLDTSNDIYFSKLDDIHQWVQNEISYSED